MKIKILILKTWCNKTITPLAWQRVVIKGLPEFRTKGYELSSLEEPAAEIFFGDAEFAIFSRILGELYSLTFPKEILDKIQAQAQ